MRCKSGRELADSQVMICQPIQIATSHSLHWSSAVTLVSIIWVNERLKACLESSQRLAGGGLHCSASGHRGRGGGGEDQSRGRLVLILCKAAVVDKFKNIRRDGRNTLLGGGRCIFFVMRTIDHGFSSFIHICESDVIHILLTPPPARSRQGGDLSTD